MSETTKQTILAVDDTLANIDVVKGVLAQDYLVQAALSGKMALKIIEKQKPDLILLDIMMQKWTVMKLRLFSSKWRVIFITNHIYYRSG